MTQRGHQARPEEVNWLIQPAVGSVLTVLSGLSFLLLCMMLPLVGKAGVVTVHYDKNFSLFVTVLVACSLLSVGALVSKRARSLRDGSPKPKLSLMLVGTCALIWSALITGLIRI